MNKYVFLVSLVLCGVFRTGPAVAESICATAEQVQIVRDYYENNPGASPVVAARQLKLSEALIGSGLPENRVAATSADAFESVWAALTQWDKAIIIITKGANVFEVFSPVSSGEMAEDNLRFNLGHDHPFAGHLRPDSYSSIYAYNLPGKKGAVTRGVFFYDEQGASVFGVMMSGKGPPAPATEVKKFDELMTLFRTFPPVCPGDS